MAYANIKTKDHFSTSQLLIDKTELSLQKWFYKQVWITLHPPVHWNKPIRWVFYFIRIFEI